LFGYASIRDRSHNDSWSSYARSIVNSPSGTGTSAYLASATDFAATSSVSVHVDGRPRWSQTPAKAADARSILEAYGRVGFRFIEDLTGSFALALFDAQTHELTLAIDRMGAAKLAWAFDSDAVLFGTSCAPISRRPNASVGVRHQAIYDYFFFHMVPGPHSVFDGVYKVQPGSAITFNRAGHREWTYWKPEFRNGRHKSERDLRDELHAALQSSVEARYNGPTTGAFLSGGLDSSTVTGFLQRISDRPADTFSIGFGVESFNELEYARITNRHFGCNAHEYEVTPDDIVDAIPILAAAFDEPFGNSSAVPTYACALRAKSLGMTRLLAGDGGDEIFGGNERYAKQQVFEMFNRIPHPLRETLRRTARRFVNPEHRITALRKLRSYVDQASIPLPERYESWNYVYREGGSDMFSAEFLGSIDVDAPMRSMREVYESSPAVDLLDKMLHYDWKFTLADNDLRKVVTACDAAGLEVEFPMLDNRVVDVSIAVPSDRKMRGLELRSFFKKAMTGFLPDEVLKKKKHGFGLPFGEWLKTHRTLADVVYGNLSDLKNRGMVRAAFLDRLIDEHRGGHAGYYGYAIWDLVMLEQWFKNQAHWASTTQGRSSSNA
jgi:asparagine synthase (glutamine-hydrolysing)